VTPSKVIGLGSRLGVLVATALVAVAAAAPSPAPAATVSANWAGYISSPSASVGSRFSSVSGSWRVSSATCSPGLESYSAVWVGLGGASENARALEQIGTDADCASSGSATYSGWYELIPAGPVNLRLKVYPGNEMSASVTVRSHDVTLRIRDLSTGARFTITKHVSSVDASSAEWIVEAPSLCVTSNACATVALTNFGTVVFSSATATADKHTGTIEDPDWSATALELRQGAGHDFGGRPGRRFGPTSALITATPSPVSGSEGFFTVSWQEQSIPVEQPSAPTLPGFGGGPP
jgi:Peptidase A4 family